MKRLLAILFLIICPFYFSQNIDKKIDEIISNMTLEAKINQLINDSYFTTKSDYENGLVGFNTSDGPHGYTLKTATSFPQSIANVATWDPNIWFELGKAMGKEFIYNNSNVQLAPCLDLTRDPRNGRTAESVGEDPLLAGVYGENVVKGIQSNAVIAVIKHLIGTNKENNRMTANIKINDDVFEEIYGLPFKRAIQEGGAFGVMSSFNQYNGQYSSENTRLLDTLLRKNWGYPYFTVSDWGGIRNSKNAIIAGTDICMGSKKYETDIPTLLSQHQITENDINKLLRHVIKTKLLAGVNEYHHQQEVDLKQNQKLALDIARKSIVLLKNEDQILPLDKTKRLAIIGPSANKIQLDGFGSSVVVPPYSISPLDGIKNKINATLVQYANGCDINSEDTTGFEEARKITQESDVVLFFGGLDATMEGEGFGTGGDRKNGKVELPDNQLKLIEILSKINPNLVVVLQSGGVCTLGDKDSLVKGYLYAFYPGMEGGNAIAEVLFGEVNPSGKLPVTIPKSTNQLPSWNDSFNDDYGHGYRYYERMNIEPQYPFGFGKSYTTFEIENLQVQKTITEYDSIDIQVQIKNKGQIDGDEVIQAYIKQKNNPLKTKKLLCFQRVNVKNGETKTVTLKFHPSDIPTYNVDKKHIETQNGEYILYIGNSINQLYQSDTITINLPNTPNFTVLNLVSFPRYPSKNDSIYYYLSLKNSGNQTIKKEEVIHFEVDNPEFGKYTTDFQLTDSFIPGGMQLIPILKKPVLFTSTGSKSIQVSCKYNEIQTTKTFVQVIESDSLNLAKNKIIKTKSNAEAISKMTDNESSTYWNSNSEEYQWILVDFNKCFNVKQINLFWQKNYAKKFYILGGTSPENLRDTIFKTKIGTPGMNKINTNFKARFIQIVCTDRDDQFDDYKVGNLAIYGDSLDYCYDINKSDFNTFPNPTFDFIFFTQKFSKENKVSIYDLFGKCLYQTTLEDESIDIQHLSDGIYIVEVIDQGERKSSKIIKLSKK